MNTADLMQQDSCAREKIVEQIHSNFFVEAGAGSGKTTILVKRMVAEGHTVGNHTMHHCDMSRLSDKASFSKELTDLEELYRQTVGREMPKFYRPPQGIYSEENLKLAKELGYKTVFWSLAYVDWNQDAQPSAEQAFSKLLPRTHDGAVVLLHSTSKTNAEILDELLTKWEEMGYRFGTLEELY
jgi:peptidoglycan-N-acetylmuramic acid deacetylase